MKLFPWIKSAFYVLLIAVAVVVVRPTITGRRDLPAFLAKHVRTMRLAYDIQGGLRFGYEIDAERVVATRLQAFAPVIEQRVREDLAAPTATVVPGAEDTLVVRFGRTVGDRLQATALAHELGMAVVDAEPEGMVLRLAEGTVTDLVEQKSALALDVLRARRDDRCHRVVVEREGSRLTVELPGIDTSQADRVRSIIER